MTTMHIVAITLQSMAAGLAVYLAMRLREHRPVAALLLGTTIANAGRLLLQYMVIAPAVDALGGDPVRGIPPALPLTGWARVAAHVDHALFLGWSAAFAVAVLAVFSGLRSRWMMAAPALVWAAMVTYFVTTYPDSRPLHRQGYLVAELFALATGVAAIAGWVRRRDPGAAVTVTQRCMFYLLALDGAALLGPYLAAGFFAQWDKARIVYSMLYVVLIWLQGGALWRLRTSS